MLKITDVVVDQSLADILPPLTPQERAALVESVLAEGFSDPIIVWLNHAILVDGYNRLDVWQKELASDPDKAPEVVERNFADRGAVEAWMIRRQLARRNLPDAIKVQLALKLKPALAAEAKERENTRKSTKMPASLSPEKQKTTRQVIADAAGVSEQTVDRVEKVLAKGTPETQAAMLAGDVNVKAAAAVAAKPKEEQPAALVEAMKPRKSQFDPSEFDDGPKRDPTGGVVASKQTQAANRLLLKLAGDFGRVVDGLGPLVCAYDAIKAEDASFAKRHKELLAHHSRLFKACEEGNAALSALKAAWARR